MERVREFQASRYLPVLLLLFAGSGCSGLVYEVVWYHLLQLAIGSTSVSLGALLAAYMGGLCIGSLALPRFNFGGRHPLRVYAALEAGIAVYAVLALSGIPYIVRIYIAGIESGLPGMLLRGAIAAICLLPPTILMGASLPAIVRWIESTPRGVAWWGLLYGGNTVGAVLGCLAAGFYLLRLYDTAVATFAAAGLNLLIAGLSVGIAARTPAQATAGERTELPTTAAGRRRGVYWAIAFSGACALGAEVVWTRLLGTMYGSTVYVFSIILAVFLVGLALGSGGASLLLRKVPARPALGWTQILLAGGIGWAAYMICNSLPYWPVEAITGEPWRMYRTDLVRCLWALLPPTVLWGASFPLAVAAIAEPGEDPGKVVGGVYAANTFGAILGALCVSLVLIPAIGTQQSQRVLLALSVASGLLLLVPHAWRAKSREPWAWMGASVLLAGLLMWNLDVIPGLVIGYGRRVTTVQGSTRVLETAEGINSSVAITQWHDGAVEIDVNGHVEATTEPYDMKLQRMVGHLPGIIHPNPRSVLGIGFGAGVSAGTFTRYPGVEHITVCEIEPVIPPISTRYFGRQNYNVMNNPRTKIVFDDARHYLMTTKQTFDIIASDPLDVFAKGTAALYSVEYFEAVKRHLNPGGIFTLYVPLYETDETTIRSELATFFEAFPNGTIWANTVNGQGYDMVFMGSAEPMTINLDEVEARMARPDYAPVAESLAEIGVYSPLDLFATYAGKRQDLAPWLAGAPLNRDRDLRLQYLAGWGINSRIEDTLYMRIMEYRRPPRGLFTGSPELVENLQRALIPGAP